MRLQSWLKIYGQKSMGSFCVQMNSSFLFHFVYSGHCFLWNLYILWNNGVMLLEFTLQLRGRILPQITDSVRQSCRPTLGVQRKGWPRPPVHMSCQLGVLTFMHCLVFKTFCVFRQTLHLELDYQNILRSVHIKI